MVMLEQEEETARAVEKFLRDQGVLG